MSNLNSTTIITFASQAVETGCTRKVQTEGGFAFCGAPAVTFFVGDGALSVQCADHPFPEGWGVPLVVEDYL